MSRLLIVLLAISGIAQAECYSRLSSKSVLNSKIDTVTDVKRTIIPEPNNQLRCRIVFRASVNDRWYTAEGENAGPNTGSIDQICAGALQSGRISILNSVAGSSISMQQDMTCTDEPIPHTKPEVRIGDAVKESELQPHPLYKNPFRFRGGMCRWFVESRPVSGDMDMSQGIICRDPTYTNETVWKVVDKW